MKLHRIVLSSLLAFLPSVSAAQAPAVPEAVEAEAASTEEDWTLRFAASRIDSSASHGTELTLTQTFRGETEQGWGIGVSGEYRFNRTVGLEAGALAGEITAEFVVDDGLTRYGDSDRLKIRGVTLAVDLHVTPRARVDFYIAPSVSLIDFSDMELEIPELGLREPLTAGETVAPGLALGLDIPFGDGGWAFSMRLRFMKAESVETDNPFWRPPIRVDVDPLFLELGLAHRW